MMYISYREVLMQTLRENCCVYSFSLWFPLAGPYLLSPPPFYRAALGSSQHLVSLSHLIMIWHCAPLTRMVSRTQSQGRLLGENADNWLDNTAQPLKVKLPFYSLEPVTHVRAGHILHPSAMKSLLRMRSSFSPP